MKFCFLFAMLFITIIEIQYRTSKTETLGEISDLKFFACTVYLIAFGIF